MSKKTFPYAFTTFIKKNWIACLILFLIPIVAITIFSILMAKGICNISDLGSMLGGTLAYLVTVLLGITSVWQVERQRIENTELMKQQYFENNRGILKIYPEVIFNTVVLVVKNVGRSPITDGSITFNSEWLNKFDEFDDKSKIKDIITKSLGSNIYLAQDQELRFYLHTVGTDTRWYQFIKQSEWKCEVCYTTLQKSIYDSLSIGFHSVLESFYGQNLTEKSVETLKQEAKKLISVLSSIEEDMVASVKMQQLIYNSLQKRNEENQDA